MFIVSFIASIVGVIFYFISPVVTIICGAISIINSIIQTVFGDQNNLGTEIFTFFVGAIISLIFDLPFLATVGFVLCIAEALLGLIGIIFMLTKY